MLEATAELPDLLLSGAGAATRVMWHYQTDATYQAALHLLMQQALNTLQDPEVQQLLADRLGEQLSQLTPAGYDIWQMKTKKTSTGGG